MPGEHIISIYKIKKLLNNDDGPILKFLATKKQIYKKFI